MEAPVVLREKIGGIITYWHCSPPAWGDSFIVTREDWRPEYTDGYRYVLRIDPVLKPDSVCFHCTGEHARHIFTWEAR